VTDFNNGPTPTFEGQPAGTPAAAPTGPGSNPNKSGQVLTGVILIAIGAIFFADRLGWEWAWGWHPTFARLWPVILIAIGISRIMSGDGSCSRPGLPSRRFGGGGWILVVGILMLLDQNRWLPLGKSWPLFIVAGGLSMLLERRAGGK
jgi:hypothetical protein